ncbi:MAG: tetratricopeptide repeat protein, partial [Candidatus Brocadiaceae bacterium]|nr:tetratricopeptide repeat protein [Candidatus Brocadiaceae bacterium]
LGIAYAKKGDMENAIYKLRKAIEINPDNPDAHFALGIIYRAKWKTKESEREISVYNRLKPGNE